MRRRILSFVLILCLAPARADNAAGNSFHNPSIGVAYVCPKGFVVLTNPKLISQAQAFAEKKLGDLKTSNKVGLQCIIMAPSQATPKFKPNLNLISESLPGSVKDQAAYGLACRAAMRSHFQGLQVLPSAAAVKIGGQSFSIIDYSQVMGGLRMRQRYYYHVDSKRHLAFGITLTNLYKDGKSELGPLEKGLAGFTFR